MMIKWYIMWRQKLEEAAGLLAADIKKNRYALVIIAAYLLLKKFFLHNACPLVQLTGLPCPACGLTRAGIALLRGDFMGAARLHLFIFAAVFWIVLVFVHRYILGRKLAELKKPAAAALILLAGYYLYRMIRYFPGDAPMSYYYDNTLMHIREIFLR